MLSDIYYGRTEHPWAMEVENWSIEKPKTIINETTYDNKDGKQIRC